MYGRPFGPGSGTGSSGSGGSWGKSRATAAGRFAGSAGNLTSGVSDPGTAWEWSAQTSGGCATWPGAARSGCVKDARTTLSSIERLGRRCRSTWVTEVRVTLSGGGRRRDSRWLGTDGSRSALAVNGAAVVAGFGAVAGARARRRGRRRASGAAGATSKGWEARFNTFWSIACRGGVWQPPSSRMTQIIPTNASTSQGLPTPKPRSLSQPASSRCESATAGSCQRLRYAASTSSAMAD